VFAADLGDDGSAFAMTEGGLMGGEEYIPEV
jgi:hypothetical protein